MTMACFQDTSKMTVGFVMAVMRFQLINPCVITIKLCSTFSVLAQGGTIAFNRPNVGVEQCMLNGTQLL